MNDKELQAWEQHREANRHRRERYYRTTDLREAEWLWREIFQLSTIDQCVERLAQEAALFLLCLDIAHADNDECECHRCRGIEGDDDGSLHAGF